MESLTAPSSLERALEFTRRGWAVLPLHSVDADGQCTCRGAEPKCQIKPTNRGKHPRLGNGVKGASKDEEQIRAWATRWPDCNWGIATGRVSGIVILDVDPRNGGTVPEDLPDTYAVRTGSGGAHIYFRHPAHAGPWRKTLDVGIDFQADGRYVVAAGSRNAGGEYVAADAPLVDLPEWVVESVRRDRSEVEQPKSTPADLDAVRTRLRRFRRPETVTLVERLLSGASVGEPGERDNALYVLAGHVARCGRGMEASALAELFDPTLKLWHGDDFASFAGDRLKVIEKIERQAIAAEQKEREAENELIRNARAQAAPVGLPTGQGSYSEEEVQAFAAQQKCTIVEFGRRWIIQVKGTYYPYANGRYRAAALDVDFDGRVRQDLAPAPVNLTRLSEKGPTPKTKAEVLREYSTAVAHVYADLTRDVGFCDVTGSIFYEAVCPRRDLETEFNPEIDRWLRLLGGEHAERLLDWLATVTDLTRPTALLYFSGASRAGKSLFADGVARLWTAHGVTKLADVSGNFNELIAECPVIFADERLPPGIDSAWLREQVTVYERSLRRKFMPSAKLRGCLRFICASNPDDMIAQGDESFTVDSLRAVGERVLHLRVGDEVSEYLSTLGGYESTRQWIEGDGFARHVLWLRDNRKVESGERLLVTGVPGAIHRSLATQSLWGSLVMEVISRHLASVGAKKFGNVKGRFFVGDGEVLVTSEGILELWESLIKSHRAPTAAKLGRAFKGFATKRARSSAWYWSVDVATLLTWEEAYGSLGVEELRNIIERPLKGAVVVSS